MLQAINLSITSSEQGALLVVSVFLLWRFYSFSIKDWLHPSRPKDLPYLIPFFGHIYSFFWSSVELMERGLNYGRRTHEPFAIQLPGKKLYIITQPEDVTEIFNNKSGIDNDFSLREILLAFSVTPPDIKRAWHVSQITDDGAETGSLIPRDICFIKWVQESYRKHLLTSKTMEEMCGVFVESLLENIQPDSLTYCRMGEENIYSLYTVIRNCLVEASAQSMFGPHLHEIDPNIVENMLGFADNAWQVVMRYPDPFGLLAVSKPRKRMMATLKRFVARPISQNCLANSFIQNVLVGMEATKLTTHSRAAMMLMIFWAAVSNEYNGTFWLMAQLLYDEPLLEQVRLETEGAWQSGKLDDKYLSEHCPVLDAVFNEVLRHKNAAGAMRLVAEKTIIGSKQLQPNNMAYIPFRQLHTNEHVWGNDSMEFDHTRFLKKKSLARNTSFRPFGGGATYCPGRTLAKREVFSAVAILLHRFDVQLARLGESCQPFPVLNIKTPSLGLNGPVKGMDIIVEMNERKSAK